jgi:7,8-dihydroneopterin aldolase/epimerase/oxygenase
MTGDGKHMAPAGAGDAGRVRRVFVNDLELVARVGVYEHEKRSMQPVVVSLELDVRDAYDGRSDRLSDVYDYDIAIRTVRNAVLRGHCNLIETLAEQIAAACLEDPIVLTVRVRIAKPDVLPACGEVGIEIERRRT